MSSSYSQVERKKNIDPKEGAYLSSLASAFEAFLFLFPLHIPAMLSFHLPQALCHNDL